ncbi:N-6 DNA methylase [Synechococcus sp. OH30]
MWNQRFPVETYETTHMTASRCSADWGWLQHMLASLNERGKMAVVLDTGAVSRGSGNQGSNRERDIRKAFVERDLIEAVILLPENLFYNTTAPGIILVVNRCKPCGGQILLIDASQQFAKGRPKNHLTEEHIARIAEIYHLTNGWQGRITIRQSMPSSPTTKRPATTTTSLLAAT